MSISVISSGFIGMPSFITFRGAKQGCIAGPIKTGPPPKVCAHGSAFSGRWAANEKSPG
jgi:hypothetical protein